MEPNVNINNQHNGTVSEESKVTKKSKSTSIPSHITPRISKADARILTHVAADFIGVDSGLEGNQWESSGLHLSASLKEIAQSPYSKLLNRSSLSETIITIDSYCKNCKVIQNLRDIKDSDKQLKALDHFVSDFTSQVKKLVPGERLFFPGGWQGALAGHAMMHVIEKSEDGSYKFYSFNTGSGIQFYHLRQSDSEGMTHFKTVQCLEEISEKNICNSIFFRSLFEMQVVPLEMGYEDRESHMIYDAILPLLKGKEAKNPSWTKEFNNAQRSGTCTWKCLMAYLKDSLSRDDYKILALLIKNNTLKNFIEFNPIETLGSRDLILVENSAEKMIRTLAKSSCPIPEPEQKILVAELKAIKTDALKQRLMKKPEIPLKSSLIFEDHPPKPIPFDVPNDPISLNQNPLIKKLNEQPIASKPTLEREEITSANVIQQLDRWGNYCAALYKEGSYLAARDCVNCILMDLPVASGLAHQDPFWDIALKASDQKEDNLIYKVGRLITDIDVKASDFERQQIILKITRLNNILYRCAFQLGASGAEDLYSAMHSFAIQSQLMASIIGFTGEDLPIGCGHGDPFSIEARNTVKDHLLFNKFSTADDLKKNFNHIGEILTKGSACLSMWGFIEHHGVYEKMNMSDVSCKSGFLASYHQFLEKKAKELGIENFQRDGRFTEALLTDIGQRNLLPRFLAAINKQAYILYLFQSDNLFSKKNLREVQPHIPLFDICFASTDKIMEGPAENYFLSLKFGVSINGVDKLPTRRNIQKISENWLQAHIDDPAFKKVVKLFAESWKSSYGNIIADKNLIDDPELHSIPYEERRELLLLSQTPPEMVIWQTLGYFSQYWDRLENKNAQSLFDLLTTNHLKEELHRNPASLHTMLTFIEQGLQQFSSPEKLEGFLFCIDFGIKIQSRLPEINQACVIWEKELRARLLDPHYTHEQKQAIQVQLAHLMLQLPYSKEQTAQVLLASACQEATPMPAFLLEESLKRTFQEHLQSHRMEFLKELKQDSKFAAMVMNNITNALFGIQDPHWELASYPHFSNESGSMVVNVLTGETRCQNSTSSPLPQSIMKMTDFQDVFGKQNFSAKLENFNLFTFTKDKLLYRVELLENDAISKINIEVQLDGQWYRYIPKDVIAKSLPPPLREGYTHWAEMEGSGQFLIKNASMESVYQGKISPNYGLGDLSKVSDPEMVYNFSTHPFLTQFEDKEQILNWSDKSGKTKKIEFPRYGLQFNLEDGKAISREFPGFNLKAHQELPTIPFLRHFLLLENDKGMPKILIPRYEMVYDEKSERLNSEGIPVKLTPPSYIAIDLNSKLKPARLNGEQAVYLAYLALVNNDYVATKHYLNLFAKADSKGDLELYLKLIGNWCFANNKSTKGPITGALGLQAILIILDKLRFTDPDSGKALNMSYSEVDKLFDSYLHNRNNATIYRLSDVEEKNLLQHLFAKGTLSNRNFARFARLQSGKPLETTIFQPPGRNDFLPHVWNKSTLRRALGDAENLISKNTSPWDGAGAIKKGLLTRPKENFVPYFLDCCFNLAKGNRVNRNDILDQLKVMQLVKEEGPRIMRDTLDRIIDYPEFFQGELDQLQNAITQGSKWPHQRGEFLAEWFSTVVKRYEENLLEFPPLEKIESEPHLPLSMPFVSKPLSKIDIKKAEAVQLIANQDIQGFFHSTTVARHGRIAPLKPLKGNPAANSQIEITNRQLDQFYADRQLNPLKKFSIERNKISTDKLTFILSEEVKTAGTQIRSLKKTILAMANAEAPEDKKFHEAKQEAGGLKAPVKMNELVALFFKGDPQAILNRCPHLNSVDYRKLTDMVFQYLQESTRSQQIQRSQDVLNEIVLLEDYVNKDIKVKGVYYPSKEDAILLISDYEEQFAKEMLAVPAYDLHNQPEYLALEYFSNLRLRTQQVQALDLLLSGKDDAKELVVQLTMGSGKTKVLLPLLAMKMADGEKFPIVVVPPALLEVNKHDLAETSLKAFGQRPYVLDFHRNSPGGKAELRFMLQSLQNCIVDKRYAIATPSSLKCLEIKFKELAFSERNFPSESEEKEEEFQLLGEIIKLLKGHGTIILDEADTILEARRSEVNFTVGNPKKVSSARIIVENMLLNVLLTEPFEKLIGLRENKQRDIKDDILKKVQEAFVDQILDKYATVEDAKILRPYFLEEKDATVPDIKGHKNEMILKQAKEVATTLLPLILKKNGNENYGRSHESHKRYAVPYVANNTPDERSEFGQVDEVMLYSGCICAQEGLKDYDVDFLIQEMLRKVRMESKSSHIPFQKTKTFNTCTTLFGIKNIFHVSSEDRANAAASVMKDLPALLYWMNNFVYPDIKTHNQKLCANSLDLVDMVPHVCGFTGTPWNRLTFHKRLQHPEIEAKIDHPEDDIAILDAIWRNVEGDREEGSSGITVINSETPSGFLEAIMNVPDAVCLLDTGAIMKGIPNKEAAMGIQKLLDQNSHIKGTLYFDEKNRIVIHLDGTEPVTLDTVAISERFSYYDQVHTTGSDIKQSPRAKAVLTFSHNTVRDWTQGAMRMRRLLTSQAIEIVVPAPTAEKIHSEGKPEFTDLLTSAIVHQSNRLADDLDYSTRQKLHHISSRKLTDLLISCDNLKDAAKIVDKFELLLSDISSDEPTFKEMKPTLETLEKFRHQQINEIKRIFEEAKDLPPHLVNKVAQLKDEILRELEEFIMPDSTLLPENRPEASTGAKLESRVEIEKEIEVNEESQRENVNSEYYNNWAHEDQWHSDIPSYKPDFLSPGTKYQKAPHVMTLHEVFESSDDLRKFEGLFDPLLRTTRNFVTTLAGQKELAFISDAQKRCYQIVIVKEKDDIAALMVDPIEAGWLRKFLPMEKQQEVIKKINNNLNKDDGSLWSSVKDAGIIPYEHQVSIRDLENGFEENMGPEFTIQDKQRAVELTTQAKFFNGYLIYSAAEWDYLKHWVAESGKAHLMKELFEKSIASQPGQHKFYERSSIQKFLVEQTSV